MGALTNSSSSTKTTMPPYIKNFTKDLFQDAKRAYNQGPYTYEGSTVTPFSKQTQEAQGGLMGLARANTGGNGMAPHLQSIMDNGGFSDGQQRTLGGMESLANNPYFSEMINGTGLTQDQSAVADRYRTQMNTGFDLASNPAYAQVRQSALDAGAQGVTAQAAKMGRLGGGANQNILGRNQMQTGANMDYGEYRNWQDQTNQAAGNLANLSQTGTQNRSNAVTQQSGLQSSLFNAQQAGLGNMGTAYQTARMPFQDMATVGAQNEDLYSRNMQDKLRQFDAQNPFNQFASYASLLQGAPKGQTTTQSMSPLQAGLGGLLAASSFF